MAAFILTNVQHLLDSDDWTAQTTDVQFSAQADMKRATTMASGGFEQFLPGLASFSANIKGLADYSASTAFSNQITSADIGAGAAGKVLSLYPNGGITAGDPAIIHAGHLSGIKQPIGNVGDVATFDLSLTGRDPSAFGVVGAPLASRSTSFTGTTLALTGPTATQRLYAALHVTVAVGTNLSVIVQSDDNAGMTTPTARITFSTVSAVGAQFSSVAGNLSTETHWRVTATSTGAFTFAVAFGVA